MFPGDFVKIEREGKDIKWGLKVPAETADVCMNLGLEELAAKREREGGRRERQRRQVGRWSLEKMSLQLAMCLTGDALSSLLLLSPAERSDYEALVGALKRRFGRCSVDSLLRSELCSRQRRPGESLRDLANNIEGLVHRTYAHMPAAIQGELAHDHFLQALLPADLERERERERERDARERKRRSQREANAERDRNRAQGRRRRRRRAGEKQAEERAGGAGAEKRLDLGLRFICKNKRKSTLLVTMSFLGGPANLHGGLSQSHSAPNREGPPEAGKEDPLWALIGSLTELSASSRQQSRLLQALVDQMEGGGEWPSERDDDESWEEIGNEERDEDCDEDWDEDDDEDWHEEKDKEEEKDEEEGKQKDKEE
ncbi:uncharacterized protein LOC133644884 [Entelurus aequoreus]|uniref:uncharacterized protein LOC133644884 n=1 Tax=Entelurus aequoreus TaxID=161455 RepID=UPI002B1E8189|nr:uncharacterized protein LOC133644884 [Entelurus aequoreus]